MGSWELCVSDLRANSAKVLGKDAASYYFQRLETIALADGAIIHWLSGRHILSQLWIWFYTVSRDYTMLAEFPSFYVLHVL